MYATKQADLVQSKSETTKIDGRTLSKISYNVSRECIELSGKTMSLCNGTH